MVARKSPKISQLERTLACDIHANLKWSQWTERPDIIVSEKETKLFGQNCNELKQIGVCEKKKSNKTKRKMKREPKSIMVTRWIDFEATVWKLDDESDSRDNRENKKWSQPAAETNCENNNQNTNIYGHGSIWPKRSDWQRQRSFSYFSFRIQCCRDVCVCVYRRASLISIFIRPNAFSFHCFISNLPLKQISFSFLCSFYR